MTRKRRQAVRRPETRRHLQRCLRSYRAAEKNALNRFIDRTIRVGAWLSSDCIHLFFFGLNEPDSLLNLRSESFTAVPQNSPVYIRRRGFESSSATSAWIDTNLNPTSSANINYSLNSAYAGVLHYSYSVSSTGTDIGAMLTTSDRLRISTQEAGSANYRLNHGGSANIVANVPTSGSGYAAASRIDASNSAYYLPNNTAQSIARPSVNLPTVSIGIGGRNSSTGIGLVTDRQYGAVVIGAYLTLYQHSIINSELFTLARSLAINV